MKIKTLIPLLFLSLVGAGQTKTDRSGHSQTPTNNVRAASVSCNNWLSNPVYGSYFDIGQLNVTGHTFTAEALIYRTTPYSGGLHYAGEIVSKHESPADVNYLLRPNNAEITTIGGHYYSTPDICEIKLNKMYHVAMVYDGSTLKFYRNGFLMSQVAASGDLIQNNWRTQIGFYQSEFVNTNFIGYINEVRIWNVARTQAEIRAYMNTSLPSPTTQTGLLAYYTFDNLLNKQGNSTFDGKLLGSAAINQSIPNCTLTIDSCDVVVNTPTTPVLPDFSIPDTVCVNAPVTITNKTVGASSYYWNFCSPDLNVSPAAVNLGNIGNTLAQPSFMDYAQDNGNYYAFVTNTFTASITRLDFGNSLLNTPTAVNLGNFNGALIEPEGIQVVKNEGKWYVIVTCLQTSTNPSSIVKIELGTNIQNATPVLTNWGNLGNLSQPWDLHLFNEGGNWYGFTVNAQNNTITRFSFTNSFNNIPTAVNLGNPGNLTTPTGIHVINDNGNWRMFIVNAGSFDPSNDLGSLTRLDFGNSLLNTPTGVNLGNPGHVLHSGRDITILKSCGQAIGFAVNAAADVNATYNDIVKFNFNNDLTSVPTALSLGNTGNFFYPNSISRIFRDKQDLYTFITNLKTGAITRLQFPGCTAASTGSSAVQNPGPVTYNTPGTYSINLLADEALPTQNSLCKQVVVLPSFAHLPLQAIGDCTDSVKIGTANTSAVNTWNTGILSDSIYAKADGIYWVESSRYGCSNRDSFNVVLKKIVLTSVNDTSVCSGKPVQLNASGALIYSWKPTTGLPNAGIANPVAKPLVSTQYVVKGSNGGSCVALDTVMITVDPAPVIVKTNDTTLCHGKTILLNVSGGNSYSWLPSATLSNTSIQNPVASPVVSTVYHVTVNNTNINQCSSTDSIKVTVKPIPVFSISPDTSACTNSAVQLSAYGGDVYTWQPAAGLSNPSIYNPLATPSASTTYTVKIVENTCKDSASLSTRLAIAPLPAVKASSSNDIDCTKPVSQLNATGAFKYVWLPAATLNDSGIAAPLSSPGVTTLYTVKGTDNNGCSNYDSVKVLVTKNGDLLVNLPNAFSPNADGYNDCFGISRYAGLLNNVDFSVYDRFGVRVFHTTNPMNCWDGRYKGSLQDAGGFVYVLKASTFCGEIFKKGVVMMLK